MPFVSGSVVKMFSYQLIRPSMATMELWRKLNPLLYVPAIPVLIYETRNYRGNTPTKLMLGNRTRFALDGREKIEFKKSLMLMLFGNLIESFFSRFKSNPDVRKILSGSNGSFSFYNKKASSERKQSNDRNNSKRKIEKKLLTASTK